MRVGVSVGMCVYLYGCACVRACAVHADLKVEAGSKLKIMLEYTRMPISHACAPLKYSPHVHTQATHELHSRTQATLFVHNSVSGMGA